MPRSRSHLESTSLLTETRRLLRRYGLHARKRLGQHFLIDRKVLGLIVETAELTSRDIVIEVGPGLGVLTRELARIAGRVIAVELDDRLAATLKESISLLHNVGVVNGDILKLDPAVLLKESGGQGKYVVVANLPYYITSPVLRHFLETSVRPQTMVVMVQKEVAETIAARPGRMSLLSVSVQFYGEPTIVGHVPAESFYPEPEVDSAVLKIDVYPQPKVAVSNINGFFGLVRAGFSAARKQLVNSLARGLGLSREEVLSLLEKAGIEPRRRAETLLLEEWAGLWEVFTESGGVKC
ncbi:MAG: 16S rRNA (adenine(1518)-N(6)/adenine(1519)-N(6))-dimethyltransferase RsmA [Dehalococcoidales bacterium]|nr:MAG: 16S rRNA (adenine(1518)-N(6)/adenine(1519)-N(6))-dimethyltransferase RsmA [Dehalococcoidales bacterium]